MSEAVVEDEIREGYKRVQLGPLDYHIPADWRVNRIGELARINPESFTPDSHDEPTFEYIDIDSVSPGRIENSKTTKIEDAPSRARRRVSEGQTLVSTVRPYLRAFAPVSAEYDGCVCSTGFAVLDSMDSAADEFLTQVALSDYFVKQMKIRQTGTSYPSVNNSDFLTVQVLTPPLPEQRRIAAVLSIVDEKIRQTREIIETTADVKSGIIQDFFSGTVFGAQTKEVRLGAQVRQIPKHWDIVSLDDISDIKRGASPRPIGDNSYFGGDIGWVRISEITDTGKYLTEMSEQLSEKGVSESVLIEPDTILLSISATIGKPAILKTKACIHDGIVALRNLQDRVSIDYLYYALQEMRPRLRAQNQRAAGHQTNVNSKVVRQSQIPLPPKHEQERVADVLDTAGQKINDNEEELDCLNQLKRGLMQDLLTGQKRTPPGLLAD